MPASYTYFGKMSKGKTKTEKYRYSNLAAGTGRNAYPTLGEVSTPVRDGGLEGEVISFKSKRLSVAYKSDCQWCEYLPNWSGFI